MRKKLRCKECKKIGIFSLHRHGDTYVGKCPECGKFVTFTEEEVA